MKDILINYFLLIGLTTYLTVLSIPTIKKIGLFYGFVDKPNKKRKFHSKPIVRLGGLSFAISFFSATLFAYFLGWFNGDAKELIKIYSLGSFLFFLVGFSEDVIKISMKLRLLFQMLISTMVWFYGVQINKIDLSFLFPNYEVFNIPSFASFLITVIWIVAITNAFNWIDGLDGLSSGIALITTISFTLLVFSIGISSITLFMASLIGSCIGFLLFNFYPAKIFMGDGGSYLIGSLIAFFSIFSHNYFINNNVNQLSFLWQFLILFVPIVDMIYVFFSRLSEGKSPFYPDRKHLHYRFQRAGFSTKETVLLAYFCCFLSSGIVFANIFKDFNFIIIAIPSLILFSFFIVKKEKTLILGQKFLNKFLNK